MSTMQPAVPATSAPAAYSSVSALDEPRRGFNWKAAGRHLFLVIMCLWVILPLLWVVLLSFKTLQDGAHNWIWPRNGFIHPFLTHYDYVLNNPRKVGPIWTLFKNSVLVTMLTVVAATVMSVLAGYALVHLRTPGSRILTALLVASMFFPTQVTAIVGIFSIQRRLGLINQTWSLMLPYTALSVAISIFIMRGVFQTVPKDLIDSAKIDGANSLRTLGGIVLPLVRNGIVVVIIVNFVAAWGEYLLALTLMNDLDKRTLPVFLGSASGGVGGLLWPRMAALYIIAIIPALITFAVAQRWYMKGLQEGALKT
ncbi:MAG: carbohydrate ABC transporter permease [Thermomicrobiales bacterium]|nr:carbohydrate ABC transporter permease [Thermomicrobiales bacterium]